MHKSHRPRYQPEQNSHNHNTTQHRQLPLTAQHTRPRYSSVDEPGKHKILSATQHYSVPTTQFTLQLIPGEADLLTPNLYQCGNSATHRTIFSHTIRTVTLEHSNILANGQLRSGLDATFANLVAIRHVQPNQHTVLNCETA